MEDLFSGIDGRFKVLMGDSTILCILHNAMNKAHEKVRSKQGVVERLNEQSKFCELAIMQLEICLKFVQEETRNYVLDNTYGKLLSDLTEIKDRLCVRLKETEIALAKKDKEIVEKDRALVAQEQELNVLRRYKEERKEGDFCELKNSVEQQVWSIKQHLEDERIAITKRINRGSSISSIDDLEVLDVVGDYNSIWSDGNDLSPSKVAFDQMGFEINKLKETLDVAFGIIQNTILDVCTLEVQWMRMVQFDIQSILFLDFIINLKDKLIFYPEQWSNLLEDVILLRNELEELVNSREVKTNSLEICVHEDFGDVRMTTDNETTTTTKGEVLKYITDLGYNIDNVIKRLNDFLNLKSKLYVISNSEDVKFEKAMTELQCVVNSGKKMICSIDNVDEDNESKLIKPEIEDSICQFKAIKEIYDCLSTSLQTEFQIELHEYEMRNSFQKGSCRNMMNQIVKELKIYVQKREMEWNNILEDYKMMLHLNEGVSHFVLKETVRDIEIRSTSNILLAHKHETYLIEKTLRSDDSFLHCHVQEDVELLLFKEMTNLWAQEWDNYRFKHSVRLEVLQCAILEIVKDCQGVIELYESHLKDEDLGSKANRNIEINDNENMIQRHDCLSHDMDIDNVHMKQSFETSEESMHLELVVDINKMHMLNKHDGMSAENVVSFSEVSSTLENVAQQGSTETIPKDLDCDEEIDANNNDVLQDCDFKSTQDDLSDFLCNSPNSMSFCDNQISFNQVFNELHENLEGKIDHKLNLYDSRLQQMSSHVQKLVKQLGVCKKKEILYKKAFILRCQNLHKAETEVDVLGDQVDTLTGLLERIYKTLDYYSPVLQHFSGVLDILIWIRNELKLGVMTTHTQHGF